MYEDRRVKKHHVQFESRERREMVDGWMGENIILTNWFPLRAKHLAQSVPFDGESNRYRWKGGESADNIRS